MSESVLVCGPNENNVVFTFFKNGKNLGYTSYNIYMYLKSYELAIYFANKKCPLLNVILHAVGIQHNHFYYEVGILASIERNFNSQRSSFNDLWEICLALAY